jgi:hypothetical protein
MKILVEKVGWEVEGYAVDDGVIPRQRANGAVTIRSRRDEVIGNCLYLSHAGDYALIGQGNWLGKVIYLIWRIQKRVWWGLGIHHGRVESKV